MIDLVIYHQTQMFSNWWKPNNESKTIWNKFRVFHDWIGLDSNLTAVEFWNSNESFRFWRCVKFQYGPLKWNNELKMIFFLLYFFVFGQCYGAHHGERRERVRAQVQRGIVRGRRGRGTPQRFGAPSWRHRRRLLGQIWRHLPLRDHRRQWPALLHW